MFESAVVLLPALLLSLQLPGLVLLEPKLRVLEQVGYSAVARPEGAQLAFHLMTFPQFPWYQSSAPKDDAGLTEVSSRIAASGQE